MQVSTWQITVSNIYLNQTRATIHVGHYPRLVIIIILFILSQFFLSTLYLGIDKRSFHETLHDDRWMFGLLHAQPKIFEIAGFAKFGAPEKRVEFSTLSNSLEIWYLGWLGYSEFDGTYKKFMRFFVFARNSLNSRNFNLVRLDWNFVFWVYRGILKMMVIIKFVCERNFDRPKKRPNF